MFDFNTAMFDLVDEVCRILPEFSHVDPNRLMIGASFNRSSRRAGLLAYVVPLKFRCGNPVDRRVRGKKIYHWAMLPRFEEGREILYIIYFMLPRFLNLSLRGKLETVVHELYHIHPLFDGSLRQFKGRSRLHGDSGVYDAWVQKHTEKFVNMPHRPQKYEFLRANYRKIVSQFGDIRAVHPEEPRPKLLRVEPLSGLPVANPIPNL